MDKVSRTIAWAVTTALLGCAAKPAVPAPFVPWPVVCLPVPNPLARDPEMRRSERASPGPLQKTWFEAHRNPAARALAAKIPSAPLDVRDITEIAIEHGDSEWGAPAYTIRFRADGSVEFDGRRRVRPLGKIRGRMGAWRFAHLARFAVELGYFHLSPVKAEAAFDVAVDYISVASNREPELVTRVIGDTPARLYDFAELIDHAAESVTWDGAISPEAVSPGSTTEFAPPPPPPERASLQPERPPSPSVEVAEASPSRVPPPNPLPESASAPLTPPVCGRMKGQPILAVHWAHGSGDARCDALETRWASENIPHTDRACRSDDECTVISSDGNCIQLALTKTAAKRSEYQTPPCGNPLSGACPDGRIAAKCENGCCVAR